MGGPEESAFAVLTPAGRGGIAVIRCVGPAAEAALARCFRAVRSSPERKSKIRPPFGGLGVMPLPGKLSYGHIIDADGRALDEVILYNAGAVHGAGRASPAAPAAGSNTAGSIFEVNCHGGPAAVRAVCERLAAAGLSEVDADRLMELEGLPRIIRDARRALRRAFTPLAARILLDQLNGALGGAIAKTLAAFGDRAPSVSSGAHSSTGETLAPEGHNPDLTVGARRPCGAQPADRAPSVSSGAHNSTGETLAPEGRDPDLTVGARAPSTAGAQGPSAQAALAAIDALLGRWRTCGRFLADPPRIVIAGRPNAGKSTLLNRLVGAERAITSAAPGTTRDYVEAEAALEGVPVVLVDTAGLGAAQGEIERQGVERARRELARAAAVVYLVDAAEGATPEDEAVLASLGNRALCVLSKIDAAGTKAVRAPSVSSGSRHRAGDAAGAKKGAVPFSGLSEKGAVPFFAPAEKGTVPFSQRREKGTAPFSALALSALTGEGAAALVAAVLEKVGWRAPGPGEAAPFTADQAEALQAARELLAAGRTNEAAQRLRSLLA